MSRPLVIELSTEKITIRPRHGKSHANQCRDLVQPATKPVLKWAGGKQWLAPAAPHLLPEKFTGRYYEPFLGGGAIFFSIAPGLATISDRNEILIAAYDALRNDTAGVIRLLSSYLHNEKFYYQIRAQSPRSACAIAARLLYLNRTCWNGLYRVNKDGQFNTPFGRFKNPTICDPDRLQQAARLLRRTKLRSGDFQEITADAKRGDLVYFDPPYISGHQYNGFLKYNAPLFSWEDQKRLAQHVRELTNAGIHVLVSNSNHHSVVSLYKDLHYYRVKRRNLIGSNVSSRGKVVEAIFSNYPLLGYESEII